MSRRITVTFLHVKAADAVISTVRQVYPTELADADAIEPVIEYMTLNGQQLGHKFTLPADSGTLFDQFLPALVVAGALSEHEPGARISEVTFPVQKGIPTTDLLAAFEKVITVPGCRPHVWDLTEEGLPEITCKFHEATAPTTLYDLVKGLAGELWGSRANFNLRGVANAHIKVEFHGVASCPLRIINGTGVAV